MASTTNPKRIEVVAKVVDLKRRLYAALLTLDADEFDATDIEVAYQLSQDEDILAFLRNTKQEKSSKVEC